MTPDDTRHLLRRFAFAATPALESRLRPLSAGAAVNLLIREARAARQPQPPAFVRTPWTNTALRFTDTTAVDDTAARAAQSRVHRADTEALRQWWIGEIAGAGPALREHLVLFFHNALGSSSAAVDVPHALHGCNALLRRGCLGTIPALLEQLVLDPAMLIQLGLDEHYRVRVSDRPAKLILDRWTVGAGAYTDEDLEDVSRALTGWALAAPDGREPARPLDPAAPRASRRTGLVPRFDERQFDAGSKIILGTKGTFGAVAAVGLLARHPATAQRFSRLLLQHFGVEDPDGVLAAQLTTVYQTSDGSVEALLQEIARSDVFWAEQSRWTMIKSPAHLAAGACRALDVQSPPLPVISRWMAACGQTLFDTPNNGEASWPGQEEWVSPPDRLAMRYQLPWVLAGQDPRAGIGPRAAAAPAPPTLPLGPALHGATAAAIAARLDAAPGIDLAQTGTGGPAPAASGPAETIRRVIMTPNYQLA